MNVSLIFLTFSLIFLTFSLIFLTFDERFINFPDNLLCTAPRVEQPFMKTDGGQVSKDMEFELFCKTEGAKIYYTTDGSPPELHLDAAKVSKWNVRFEEVLTNDLKKLKTKL